MKRFLMYMVVLMGALTALGQTYWTPDNLPMVYLQDRTKYVINPDGVLAETTVDSLNRLLRLMETETGVQSVVAVVKHIEGDDPYSFGQEVSDKYGIGHKGKDDGLFVMLCTEDRSYTILTGDGLEGALPDAVCRRIQNREMIPLLKKGDWDGAMMATMSAIDGYIRGDEDFRQGYMDDDVGEEDIVVIFAFFSLILIALVVIVSFASVKKCPRCGQRKMKGVKSELIGRRKRRVTYRCSNCGHEETKDVNVDDGTSGLGRGMGGGMMMGGGRGFGGGGGSIGGHFGGGHFGGGGSTGRF